MHPNHQTIETFYAAFARLDPEAMSHCYAADAVFEDEVFSLRGKREVVGMWTMLCEATQAKGRDVWRLEYSGIDADAQAGKAHWDAHYRFSTTGRMVDNHIDAAFTFNPQGLIASHRDRFDFWAWSRQALGPPGLLLGWTPMLKSKVRAGAAKNLAAYMARTP